MIVCHHVVLSLSQTQTNPMPAWIGISIYYMLLDERHLCADYTSSFLPLFLPPFSPSPSSPSFLPPPVRHHVDLVRSPEHPEMEGEYVVEVDGGTYRVWVGDGMPKPQVKWEWHLKHLRRIHWHKTVNKLEVEAGRCVSVALIILKR